jgi:hypothetical protein
VVRAFDVVTDVDTPNSGCVLLRIAMSDSEESDDGAFIHFRFTPAQKEKLKELLKDSEWRRAPAIPESGTKREEGAKMAM